MSEKKEDIQLIKSVKKLFKQDKFISAVALMGLLGILIIYLSSFFGGDSKTEKKPEEQLSITIAEYENKLEDKLIKIVSAITGEENPVIMLTLEGESTFVYAKNEKSSVTDNDEYQESGIKSTENSNDNETSYIILKDESGSEHALKITEIQPEVKGVVVVSGYANNILVKEKITNAVRTALGISSSKVCVVGAN